MLSSDPILKKMKTSVIFIVALITIFLISLTPLKSIAQKINELFISI